MNKKITFLVLFLSLSAVVLLPACKKNIDQLSLQQKKTESVKTAKCQPVVINDTLYKNAVSDTFVLKNALIVDSCLKITIQYGGGCGDIAAELLTNSCVFETLPPQKDMFFEFKDMDSCEALITKEFCFDISSLKYPDSNTLLLNIKNMGIQLTFNY